MAREPITRRKLAELELKSLREVGEYYARQSSALRKLWRAVRAGKIENCRGKPCVDCGQPATVHEHRDYREPLVVEPVCAGCNARRPRTADFPELQYKGESTPRKRDATWDMADLVPFSRTPPHAPHLCREWQQDNPDDYALICERIATVSGIATVIVRQEFESYPQDGLLVAGKGTRAAA